MGITKRNKPKGSFRYLQVGCLIFCPFINKIVKSDQAVKKFFQIFLFLSYYSNITRVSSHVAILVVFCASKNTKIFFPRV